MKQAVFNLDTLTCPSCVQKIENALKQTEGVAENSVEVLFNSSRVRASFDEETVSLKKLDEKIEALGFKVLKSRYK